ncbi:MAG: sulfatase-like hydrolase/transferase [Deltaproteobacteria bacterium]|nr:sulfatase-like hydrolase/transferase [Deltaproteobacteria bacterium]
MNKPNIIFINTDQQTWNTISAYGNPHLNTPHIDRIIHNGVSFMRSYCTDPVCSPARSSWATGMYSSETGVPFNGGSLHSDIPDLGQILRAHNYNAYHTGKWHVSGRDVRESFQCLFFGKRTIPAGGGEFYDPVTTRSVVDFLSRYEENKPFYLQIGYVNPHDICEYEHNHEQKNIPDPVEQGFLSSEELPPLPANFNYDERETVTQIVMRRGDNPLIHKRIMAAAANWSERHWRYLLWQLYRFVEKVDVEIGMVLNALEATPFKDNTLIIFSVDHGEAAGSHQMIQKCTLYEESIKVPLVVASLSDRFILDKDTRDEEHFVSGVDLLPTILDYAGLEIPEHVSGMSIRPLVEKQTTNWRKHAYVESNCWGRALISDRYKYITEYIPREDEFTIPGPAPERLGKEQLFDLQEDPAETRNIVDDPQNEDLLNEFRQTLFSIEGKLNRRPHCAKRSKQVINNWSKRILDYWKTQLSS